MFAETSTLSTTPIDPAAIARARHLARIAKILAGAPEVRSELVDDLQKQLNEGDYMSEEKLDLAIGRMLRDILR